jgi:ABC-2 type transport system permease protein
MSITENLRITWAIAAKDIVDAVKNKTTLTNIVLVFVMMVIYRAMPAVTSADDPIRVLVYDAGDSTLVETLKKSPALKVYAQSSRQELLTKMRGGDDDELGLVIPAGFDQALAAGASPELEGYVVYWASDRALDELTSQVEQEIAEWTGQPVHIRLNEERLYPEPASPEIGSALMTSLMALFFALTMIGVTTAPILMIEEKETKTMDVLLVSPARSGHLVAGKALAGLFYCLTAAVVILAFSSTLIISWGIVIAVVILGSLFAVAVGLLLGMLCPTKQHYTICTMGLMAVLFLPFFLAVMRDILPGAVSAIIPWLPTAALAEASWSTFAQTVPWSAFGPQLMLVAGYTLLILAAVAWIVRRADR